MTKIGWFLGVVMARRRVSNADLAERLGKHPTSISKMRTAQSMPRMSGADLEALCEALSVLSGKNIEPNDLLMEEPMEAHQERQRNLAAMQQTVADAQAQVEAMQRNLEEQQQQLVEVRAKLQEYW